jgi:hypothetical protein
VGNPDTERKMMAFRMSPEDFVRMQMERNSARLTQGMVKIASPEMLAKGRARREIERRKEERELRDMNSDEFQIGWH